MLAAVLVAAAVVGDVTAEIGAMMDDEIRGGLVRILLPFDRVAVTVVGEIGGE